ncbi:MULTISPECIES: hypothetical protein [Acetobacter]|uniref:Uncharacterized protein n=1 Tax=Acetobacter thailandicus TaxID=1502842 RepID=A0ABT3QEH8_9PROT|nr:MULTISPECIES: hypothetical protein [Acetobacter]MCX2563660.1 hypothetical protein [Acetobacter thailandicus]
MHSLTLVLTAAALGLSLSIAHDTKKDHWVSPITTRSVSIFLAGN